MQEEVLSSRQLVFVNGQIFYCCGKSHYCEASNWPSRELYSSDRPIGSLLHTVAIDFTGDFDDFCLILMYYTQRKHSYPGDILRAFEGILRKFNTFSGTYHFEGLPVPLEKSLAFTTSGFDQSVQRPGRRVGFPSYSWTGWYGEIHYDESLKVNIDILTDFAAQERQHNSAPRLRTWVNWHCMLHDRTVFHINDTGRLRRTVNLNLENSISKARSDFQRIPAPISDVDFRAVRPSNPYPLLLFWTICINLPLKEDMNTNPQSRAYRVSKGLVDYRVIDGYGKDHGLVQMDIVAHGFEEGKFAILSMTDDTIWALMLTGTGDISERCGIAKLSLSAMDIALRPGPRWKKVILG